MGPRHLHHTLPFYHILTPRVKPRVDHGRQAGRNGRDTRSTHPHTCTHAHGHAHPHAGAYYGGPGSRDAREIPPADAEAAGGDSAEEQWREGETQAHVKFNFVFLCLVMLVCVCVCERARERERFIKRFLANPGNRIRSELEESKSRAKLLICAVDNTSLCSLSCQSSQPSLSVTTSIFHCCPSWLQAYRKVSERESSFSCH